MDDDREYSFVATVLMGKKEEVKKRIIKASNAIEARQLLYAQLFKKEKIKDFQITEVKQKGK